MGEIKTIERIKAGRLREKKGPNKTESQRWLSKDSVRSKALFCLEDNQKLMRRGGLMGPQLCLQNPFHLPVIWMCNVKD